MLLITGASGRIGRRAAEVVAQQQVPLCPMSRTPEQAPHPIGVEVVHGDFAQPDTLAHAFRGVDAALVISGSAPPGQRALDHRNAFVAAARAGVRHVVYVSLQGTGPASKFSYSRDHETSERFLRGSGIPAFTILRNAFYLDMFPGFVDEKRRAAGSSGIQRGTAARPSFRAKTRRAPRPRCCSIHPEAASTSPGPRRRASPMRSRGWRG